MRRDMLALLSTSSANVAPTASCLTTSSAWGIPSSSTVNCGRCQPLQEAAFLVLDDGVEQDAGDLRHFDDVERFQDDLVANLVTERIVEGHGDFASFERILVHPLRGIRRAVVGVRAAGVDEEADRPDGAFCAVLHLGDDADRARQPGASER